MSLCRVWPVDGLSGHRRHKRDVSNIMIMRYLTIGDGVDER